MISVFFLLVLIFNLYTTIMEDLLEAKRLKAKLLEEEVLNAKLFKLEKKFNAAVVLHKSKCKITDLMDEEWQLEKTELSDKYNIPDVGIAIYNLIGGNFEFHNNIHDKWLLHPAIDLNQPNDQSLLKDLITLADRVTFIENLLVGYDLLMSLPPQERKNWWMKFHLSLKNKSAKPFSYVIGIRAYKFDKSHCPWQTIIKIVRLSETWVPSEKHYCEYSHRINSDIRRIHKVKPRIVIKLTALELEVLKLGHEGYSVEATAEIMRSNIKRIKNARERIYRKTNTHNMDQAYLYVQKHDLAD